MIKMPNLYLVISEQLEHTPSFSGLEPPLEPPEVYHIACLVVARNRSQAMYKAWETDESFTGNPLDKPKMSCNLRYKDCKLPIGVPEDQYKYNRYWYSGKYKGQDGYIEPVICDLCGYEINEGEGFYETGVGFGGKAYILCVECEKLVKPEELSYWKVI